MSVCHLYKFFFINTKKPGNINPVAVWVCRDYKS